MSFDLIVGSKALLIVSIKACFEPFTVLIRVKVLLDLFQLHNIMRYVTISNLLLETWQKTTTR